MKTYKIKSLYDFLDSTGRQSKNEIVLYRGQDCNEPLLPRIARKNPSKDTSVLERTMLTELRRIGGAYLSSQNEGDLDLLVRAQHYGMATRLLDWSSNPLVAMWFACCDSDEQRNGFVYFYEPDNADGISSSKEIDDPLGISRTLVFKPNWNNARIGAQGGWFTLHPHVAAGNKFVALNHNVKHKAMITAYEIDGGEKNDFLIDLDHMGINHQSLFPDLVGVCKYLNWKHDAEGGS